MIQTNYIQYLLQESIKQGKQLLMDKGLHPDQETDFNDITHMLRKSPNLIGNFTKYHYENDIDMTSIKRVVDWLFNNRHIVSNLPKNVIEYDSFEELEDDITVVKTKNVAKKFYNKVYKSILNDFSKLTEEQRKEIDELAYAFGSLDYEIQRMFLSILKHFNRNDATIEEFYNSFKLFMEKNIVNDTQEFVSDKIKKFGDKITTTYNVDGILILQTNDRDAIIELGSEKWCIVYAPNLHQKNYIKDFATQYIVFNFNLPTTNDYSMFGITVKTNGTTPSGGCQSKFNHYIELSKVNELLGLTDRIKNDKLEKEVIIPSEKMLNGRKELESTIGKIRSSSIDDSFKIVTDYENKYGTNQDIQATKDMKIISEITDSDDFNYIFRILRMFKFDHTKESTLIRHIKELVNGIIHGETTDLYKYFLKYPELLYHLRFTDLFKPNIEDYLYITIMKHMKSTSNYRIQFDYNIKSIKQYESILDELNNEKISNIVDDILENGYGISIDNVSTYKDGLYGEVDAFIIRLRDGILDNSDNLPFDEYKMIYDKYFLKELDIDNDEEPYYTYFNEYFTLFDFMGYDNFLPFLSENYDETIDTDGILDDISYYIGDYQVYNSDNKDNTKTKENIKKLFSIKNKNGDYMIPADSDINKLLIYRFTDRIDSKTIYDQLGVNTLINKNGKTVYYTRMKLTDLNEYFDNDNEVFNIDTHGIHSTSDYHDTSTIKDSASELLNDKNIQYLHNELIEQLSEYSYDDYQDEYDDNNISIDDITEFIEIKDDVTKIKNEISNFIDFFYDVDNYDIKNIIEYAYNDTYEYLYTKELMDNTINELYRQLERNWFNDSPNIFNNGNTYKLQEIEDENSDYGHTRYIDLSLDLKSIINTNLYDELSSYSDNVNIESFFYCMFVSRDNKVKTEYIDVTQTYLSQYDKDTVYYYNDVFGEG